MFEGLVEALTRSREFVDVAIEDGMMGSYPRELRAQIETAIRELSSPQAQAVQAILSERAAQDAQWGGAAHDDKHMPEDWLCFIGRQLDKWTADPSAPDGEAERSRLIKTGALSVAGLESYARRKHAADLAKASQQILAEGAPI